jgi:hypothetical protein
MVYFLAACLTFPRAKSDIAQLDEHYWARKRIVARDILFVNRPGTYGESVCGSDLLPHSHFSLATGIVPIDPSSH